MRSRFRIPREGRDPAGWRRQREPQWERGEYPEVRMEAKRRILDERRQPAAVVWPSMALQWPPGREHERNLSAAARNVWDPMGAGQIQNPVALFDAANRRQIKGAPAVICSDRRSNPGFHRGPRLVRLRADLPAPCTARKPKRSPPALSIRSRGARHAI